MEKIKNEMKICNKKNRIYLILLISAYIFVYLFRIDKNVLAIQEYDSHPHRTYNGLIVGDNAPNFYSKVKCPVTVKLFYHLDKAIAEKPTWQYTSALYELRVTVFLREQKENFNQSTNIISARHKKNIHHKSSEDDIAVS
jgi:hypothetical protein